MYLFPCAFLLVTALHIQPWTAASSPKRPRAFRVVGHYNMIIEAMGGPSAGPRFNFIQAQTEGISFLPSVTRPWCCNISGRLFASDRRPLFAGTSVPSNCIALHKDTLLCISCSYSSASLASQDLKIEMSSAPSYASLLGDRDVIECGFPVRKKRFSELLHD